MTSTGTKQIADALLALADAAEDYDASCGRYILGGGNVSGSNADVDLALADLNAAVQIAAKAIIGADVRAALDLLPLHKVAWAITGFAGEVRAERLAADFLAKESLT